MAQDEGVRGSGSAGSTERQDATLANAVADGLFQVDADDRLVAVNDALLDAVGRSREELIGASLDRAFPSADAERLSTARRGLIESEPDTVTLPATLPTADGGSRQCEIRLRLVDGTDGGAAGTIRVAEEPIDDRFDPTLPTDLPGIVYRCKNERGWPVEYVSNGSKSLTGYEPAELMTGEANWATDVIDDRDRETVWNDVQSTLERGDEFEIEYRIRTPDGASKWVSERGHAIRDDAGEVTALEGFVTDVTDDKETRKQLRDETEKFRSLVDAVEEYAIFMLDPEGQITSWNQGAERIKGYDAEEVLGEHISLFYTDEDRAEGVPEGNLAEAAETGQVEDEGWRVRADGSRFWANVVITPVRDDDGSLSGYAKVTRDMTERREHEETLRRQRDLTERILEASPIGIAALTVGGDIEKLNDQAAAIVGTTMEEVQDGTYRGPDWNVYDENGDPVPPEERAFARVVRTGEPVFGFESQVERPDGERRWLTVNGVPIADSSGEMTHVVLTYEDHTERRENEEALRRERNLVTKILETSPVGIALVDEDNELVRTNDRAATFAGRTPDELLELSATEIELYDEDGEVVPPEDHPSRRALESGESVVGGEYQVEWPDGQRQWLTIDATVIEDASEARVVLAIQDITSLKRREAQLRRERDLTEQILSANPVGIAVVDSSGEITRLNESGAEVLGVEPEYMDQYDLDDWTIFDEDGTQVPPPEWPQSRSLRTGESVFDWRCEIVGQDGTRRWVSANAVPIRDEGGTVERIILTANDITPLKRREADLRRERDLVETVIEASPIMIGVFDAGDWSLLQANAYAKQFLGVREGDFGSYEYVAGDVSLYDEAGGQIPPEERPFARAIETGEPVYDWQGIMEGAEDERRWFSINATPLVEDDSVERVVVVGDDITQLKEREQQLRKERDLTERILETSPVGIGVLSAGDEIEYVNDRGQEILGIDTETPDTASDSYGRLLDESDSPVPDEERPSVRAFSTGEQVTDWQCQYDHPDGGMRWLSINSTPVYGEDGEVERVITVGDDITQLKEQARQLERQRDDLASELDEMFRRIDDAFYAVDDQFRFTYVNERAEKLLRHEESELLGQSISEVFPEAAETAAWESFHEALENQEPTSYEVFFEPLGFWVEANVYPSETGLSVYFRDVTERKERERELETYETIVKTVDDGVYVCDEEFRFTMVNDAYVEMTGYDGEELLGAHASLVVDEDVSAESAERLQEIASGEATSAAIEADIHRADGSRLRAESKFTDIPSDDAERPRKVGVVRDVTERNERERALEESRNRYQALVENFPNGAVALVDEDLRYKTVGGTPIRGSNATVAQLEGSKVDEILPPDIADVLVPRYADALDGERSAFEQEVGGRIYQFWTLPVHNDSGDVFAALGMSQDITERKERERALEESERRYRTLVEHFPNGTVALFDDDLQYTAVGGELIEQLDLTPEDVIGDVVTERYPDDLVEQIEPHFRAALEGESTTFEAELYGLDLYAHTLPVRNADDEVYAGMLVVQDVTELRERERELERYETIVETVNDGIYVVDEQGRFTMVNGEYASMTGYTREELVGADVSLVVEDSTAGQAQIVQEELASGESHSATLEADIRTADGGLVPAEATFALMETDDTVERIGVARDITERRERERKLEESERQYRTLAENFPNGGVALFDEDLRYTLLEGSVFDEYKTPKADLIDKRVGDLSPDAESRERLVEYCRAALDGETNTYEFEWRDQTFKAWVVPVADESGNVFAGMTVTQEITEQRERQRELQTRVSQQETVTDLGQQALSERDLDELFTEATERVAETLDADYCKVLELLPGGEEVLLRSGVGWRDCLVGDATVDTRLNSQAGYTLRSEEPVVVDDLATESRFSGPELLTSHDVTSGVSTIIGTADNPWGVLGVHSTDEREFSEHDVNFVQSVATILATAIERADRERDLERYETIVETVDDGVYALDPDGKFVLVNDAFCEMTGYDREELIGRPGKTVHDDDIDGAAGRLAGEVEDGQRKAATLEFELRAADGGTIPVESRFGPYPYDDERFGRTGVVRDVTERLERERALKRQREELAALNRLNQVVGEITHAAVESSSREEIEQLVCERLADSESYQFAWVGEVARTSDTVALRTEAGVSGYLDDVTITVDSEDGIEGPTARAIRTHEPQVVRDTATDPDYESWREVASEYGFRSSVAIPITYEDVLYGVLNVYSRRPGAFDGYERTLLARLGNVVGHAINALERKEALMTDQVQEVDLQMEPTSAVVDEQVSTDGSITFERTVPVGDGTYLQYGTADREAMAMLEGLLEVLPFWEELTILDERFDPVSFELRLSEPPAISTAATYGGRVESATIENGTYQMRVEIPPAADVRVVVEALQEEYPELELVAQRRTVRDTQSIRQIDDVLEEQLTDRQRAALETAFYAGYFDTPRKRSGEAVAESLDITAPTLHQHLRKGQRKLLSTVFGGPGK